MPLEKNNKVKFRNYYSFFIALIIICIAVFKFKLDSHTDITGNTFPNVMETEPGPDQRPSEWAGDDRFGR